MLLLVLAAPASHGETLLVAGAVSLREPLQEIARAYGDAHPGVRVDLSFGASSALAAQLRAGAPIDLLVSADARIVDGLARDGVVARDSEVVIATNRLTVLAARGAPPLRSAADLAGPEVRRIAIGDRGVPVGRYARSWLRERGLLATLEPRLIPLEHARATLAAVDTGAVDAAIVYVTDAQRARSARVAFEIPEAEQPRIVYVAAAAHDADAAVPAFVAFLRSPEAMRALGAAGFRTP